MHCYILNFEAMVSLRFPHYKSIEANDPQDMVNLDPRDMVVTIHLRTIRHYYKLNIYAVALMVIDKMLKVFHIICPLELLIQ